MTRLYIYPLFASDLGMQCLLISTWNDQWSVATKTPAKLQRSSVWHASRSFKYPAIRGKPVITWCLGLIDYLDLGFLQKPYEIWNKFHIKLVHWYKNINGILEDFPTAYGVCMCQSKWRQILGTVSIMAGFIRVSSLDNFNILQIPQMHNWKSTPF